MSACRMLDTRTISWTVTSIILTMATVTIMVGSSEPQRELLTLGTDRQWRSAAAGRDDHDVTSLRRG
jgi:hypothetical protein